MDKIKNLKFTTTRLTSQEGFLHFNHFILAILTIIGLHITGDLYDSLDTKGDYWTGALWGASIGILGIFALVIILCSIVVKLPSQILFAYYCFAATVTFIVASLGLSINKHVESYNDCMKENASGIRCDYGFLVNRFIIFAISILHAMMYVVSLCIVVNAKPEITVTVTEGNISIGDTTATSTTTKSSA